MNTRLNIIVVVVAASLASCYAPPPRPVRPQTGVNLDRPASGDRSARETRYLEEEVNQAPQAQLPPGPPADPNAPPTTDPATVQAPTGATPPSTSPPTVAPGQSTPPAGAGGAATPPAATPPAAAPELPYGVPVPGKKGFVYSPYDKSAGFVDVRDIGPGTKVRCPYTGKIFRVP